MQTRNEAGRGTNGCQQKQRRRQEQTFLRSLIGPRGIGRVAVELSLTRYELSRAANGLPVAGPTRSRLEKAYGLPMSILQRPVATMLAELYAAAKVAGVEPNVGTPQ
jgi:hypothetical protein